MPIPGKSPEESAALRLRQVDLLQRFYLSGQFMQTENTAVDLLEAKWDEPVAGCLGGYLMLRLGKPQELDVAASNLTRHFGNLSDTHVLKAEYQASISYQAVALEEFRQALNQGLPLCADGLSRLYTASGSTTLSTQTSPCSKPCSRTGSRGCCGRPGCPGSSPPASPCRGDRNDPAPPNGRWNKGGTEYARAKTGCGTRASSQP